MGIKGLVRWLRYKIRPSFIHQRPCVNTLFIDAKQLFYLKSVKSADKGQNILVFLKKIQWVIDNFTPADTLFLSMDGPNPAAKFQTQRYRKFRDEYAADFSFPKEPFSMLSHEQPSEAIHKSIQKFLQDYINNPNIKTKQFLYSSGFAPGESEHKYFDFFREEKRSSRLKPKQNHFIFSNDNDLIFLPLQFVDENFYIVKFFEKDDNFTTDIIDISVIRKYFINLIRNPFNNNKNVPKNINEPKVINDIVALSFLLGNDFIPPFPEVASIDIDSFQKLLDSYIALNSNNNDNNSSYKYLIENDSFNVQTLKDFIKIFFNEGENQAQNDPNSNNPELLEIAQMILRTLNFTWLYYSHGVPSWTFYYPHTKSPSLKQIVPLMTQEGKEFFESIQYDEITDPFLKALVIHPVEYVSNIPWNIYQIKIPPSPIAEKYWPHIKPEDLDEKMPIFNLDEIIPIYKKNLATLSQEELYLNRRDPPFFVYTKNEFIEKRTKYPIK